MTGPLTLLARLMQAIQRGALVEPDRGPVAPDPAPERPGDFRPARAVARWLGPVMAILLPSAVAALLVAFRGPLASTSSLVMVVPVVVVSVLAGARAGVVAAVVGAFAFGVLLTEPYYRLRIADPDDIAEAVALLAIGVLVGVVSDRARRDRSISTARGREVRAVARFLDEVAAAGTTEAIVIAAERAISTLLSARHCDWRAGYHGTVGGVLGADGGLTSGTSPRSDTRARALPTVVEIPVGGAAVELGRFVVRTDERAVVSVEERRAAAGVAAVVGAFLR
jgi:hypothetical protein